VLYILIANMYDIVAGGRQGYGKLR